MKVTCALLFIVIGRALAQSETGVTWKHLSTKTGDLQSSDGRNCSS